MTRPVQSAILLAPSDARRQIYELLISQPRGQWSVRDMAAQLPAVSVEAIRSTVYLLMDEDILRRLPKQRSLVVRLAEDGPATLAEILGEWAVQVKATAGGVW